MDNSSDDDFLDLPGPSTRARVKRKQWPADDDPGGTSSNKVGGGGSGKALKKKMSEDQVLKEDRNETKDEEKRRKNKEKNAKWRAARSEEKKAAAREANKKRMAQLRESQDANEREAEKEKKRERWHLQRSLMTEEEREEEQVATRRRVQVHRAQMTEERREEERQKTRRRVDDHQRLVKTKVDFKDGLRSQEILSGIFLIPTLENSADAIGLMNVKCDHCRALKYLKETPAFCCGNGKVVLSPYPRPPQELMDLWLGDESKARLFREHAKSINNAVCLSSIQVRQRQFDGFNPSVIFQGKVKHRAGPLIPDDGEVPRFAQLYVHDPSMETSQRFHNMVLPSNLSALKKETLKVLLNSVQEVIKDVNPFVKDFKQILDLPDEEIAEGKIAITAKTPAGQHVRRYNQQTNLQEVSILTNCEPHDLIIHKRGGGLQSISDLNPKGMPLHFVLLFPYGTYGWNPEEKHADGVRRTATREYFAFHIQIRDIGNENFLHMAERLFQEWLCMAWVTVENQRLTFQQLNQKTLRADSYKSVKQAVEDRRRELELRADTDFNENSSIRTKILASSFTGGPRWYNSKFQNGMAICREYHKPDLFITMTCNPNWPEIKRELKPDQKPQNRADVIARVFKLKQDQLMRDLTVGGLFGRTVAHMSVIEFQKRGLPHVHILIILAAEDRNISPEFVDSILVAELPPSPTEVDNPAAKEQCKILEEVVLSSMIHGPCGKENPSSPCMDNNKCTKNFPKDFLKDTIVDTEKNYASPRRRKPEDGGRTAMKNDRLIDNRWVVPYNPYLSLRYNCHINVEFCASPKAAKYLYKYVTKGNDQAMVATEVNDQPRDEISEYQDLRSVGSSEAVWHLLGFPITKQYPAVKALRVHLEEQQQIVFDAEAEIDALENQRDTELTAFFSYNREARENGESLEDLPKYVDMPKSHVFSKKTWRKRKQQQKEPTIGRVHTVNPAAGDVYFLRVLLHDPHCRGKVSFEDMLTAPSGRVCETYKEVCSELGLLNDDREWHNILDEAAVTQMCPQIRQLFVIILMFCMPSDPVSLFLEFWHTWTDDFSRRHNQHLSRRVLLSFDCQFPLWRNWLRWSM